MKRNPNEQLVALLEGLDLPSIIEGKTMLDHLMSSPRELRETGETVSVLASIGMSDVDRVWDAGQSGSGPKNINGEN